MVDVGCAGGYGLERPGWPPAMAERCATTENVLPTVSGTRSLRQDTHVLLCVEAIRLGHVTVCQFTDQREPSLPGSPKFDDAAERLARIRESLALVVCDVERPFARGRFGKAHRGR